MALSSPSKLALIKRVVLDFRLLVALGKDFITGRYRDISALFGVVCVPVLAYLFIPMDLINDFIPGLGQMDDSAVFLFGLWFLERDLYRYRSWKERTALNSGDTKVR